jgi:hypothetical protein
MVYDTQITTVNGVYKPIDNHIVLTVYGMIYFHDGL